MKAVRKRSIGKTKQKAKGLAGGSGSGSKKRYLIDWSKSITPTPGQIDEICEQHDLSEKDSKLIQEFCDDFLLDVRLLHLENESMILEEAPISKFED